MLSEHAESIKKTLKELTDFQRKAFDGLGEGTTSAQKPAAKHLDEKMARIFKRNLDQGVSAEAFFVANADVLEPIANYDLAEFGIKTDASAASRLTGGSKKLDGPMGKVLRSHLAGGGTVNEFFEANSDILGKASDYDLTGF